MIASALGASDYTEEITITAAVMCSLAQTAGNSLGVEWAGRRISPAFNLLTVYKSSRPRWLETVGKLLPEAADVVRDLEDQYGELRATADGASPETPSPPLSSNLHSAIGSWHGSTGIRLGNNLVRRCLEVVSVRKALSLSPDGAVGLVDPEYPLSEMLRDLDERSRGSLRDLLAGNDPVPGSNGAPGSLTFMWSIPRSEFSAVRTLMRLRSLPVLILPVGSVSDPEGKPVASPVLRLLREIRDKMLAFRLTSALRGRRALEIDADLHREIEDLRSAASAWGEGAGRSHAPNSPWISWISDLAVKVALLHHVTSGVGGSRIEDSSLRYGISFAKEVALLHLDFLEGASGGDFPDFTDTADLTDKQRRVYLVISRDGPIAPSELPRRIRGLRAEERDEAVIALLARGLVRWEGRKLQQKLPACSSAITPAEGGTDGWQTMISG